MIPSDDLLRSMLVKSGPKEVRDTLTAQGYVVAYTRCQRIRSTMMAQDDCAPLPKSTVVLAAYGDPALSAKTSCDALLRAQLKAGLHWIGDRQRFAEACAGVGLVPA